MGFMETLLRPRAVANVNDERYWQDISIGARASSGSYVSAQTALMASPVWACTRLIAESLATMPAIMFRRTNDGGKTRAPHHPIYQVLHDAPNDYQTAFVWKRTMMVHALLYGNAYSRIMPGMRGAVDHLDPLHPDNVRMEQLPGGGTRYMVRSEKGIEQPVNEEDMFHLPGLSLDGFNGLSLVHYARESIGLALAAEEYSARFYSQNAQPGGILKTDQAMSKEGAERNKQAWQDAHAGPDNWHKTAVLGEGLEWQQLGMTHADAELIAQLDWSAADVARFFNVPLHMIQLMTKTTSWGSGIEEMGIEFVVFSLLPWIKNWEQLIAKKLILATGTYFCEFLVDSLMRGKQGDRYKAYATGRQWGWLSANDIRRLENMNPIPGGDEYLRPMNMEDSSTPARASVQGMAYAPMAAEPASQEAQGHYHLLLHEAAARVIRKEIAVMSKAAKRCASDQEGWHTAVEEFYSEHGAFVAETLRIGKAEAEQYATEQATDLLAHGASIMEDWETRRAGDLIALALGGQDD